MLPERRTGATLGDMQLRSTSDLLMQGRRRARPRSFPRSLLQNELIQRQIGNRLAQPAVLELKVLQAVQAAAATST